MDAKKLATDLDQKAREIDVYADELERAEQHDEAAGDRKTASMLRLIAGVVRQQVEAAPVFPTEGKWWIHPGGAWCNKPDGSEGEHFCDETRGKSYYSDARLLEVELTPCTRAEAIAHCGPWLAELLAERAANAPETGE